MNRLLSRLDAMEATREEYLARVAALPADRRGIRASPEVWSPLEVIEHFVRAERDVMRGLFEPEYLKVRPQGVRSRVLRLVVMGILRFGVRVKAPSKAMLPEGDLSLDELTERWRANHGRLRAFLEGTSADELSKACFRHPVSGPLTPAQALDLAAVHLKHHDRQLAEAVRHAAD